MENQIYLYPQKGFNWEITPEGIQTTIELLDCCKEFIQWVLL